MEGSENFLPKVLQHFQVNMLDFRMHLLKMFLDPINLFAQAINNVLSVLKEKQFQLVFILDVLDVLEKKWKVVLLQVVLGQLSTVHINLCLVSAKNNLSKELVKNSAKKSKKKKNFLPDNSVSHIDSLDVMNLPHHDVTLQLFVQKH